MSRPKTALTGAKPYSISARLTSEQRVMFLRLGGSRWLRETIESAMINDTLNKHRAQTRTNA